MNVTRDVILDLLPLYLANEASEDSRVLVEQFLQQDPQLAALAEKAKLAPLPEEIPIPLTREDEMQAFDKAKKLMFQHNLFLILAVLFTFLFAMGLTFLWDERPIGPVIFAIIGGVFWAIYWRVNKRLGG